MDGVTYVEGGAEMLPALKEMWERLNARNAAVSPDFGWLYAGRDFAWRMEKWPRPGPGGIRVCKAVAGGAEAGSRACLLDEAGGGEVASIYVDASQRRKGIGGELLRRGPAWLGANGASGVGLEVAAGKEGAVAFYRSLGFKLRSSRMWLPPEETAPR